MTIVHFGFFDPAYSRNRTTRKGLEAVGETVVPIVAPRAGLVPALRLVKQLLALKGRYDAVLVGYSDDRLGVLLARLFSKRPVVWDAFYSIYDSRVNDRQLVSTWNPKAWWYWLLDYTASHCASLMLVDTHEHAKYFAQTFHVPLKKCIRVFLGTDSDVFYPRAAQEQKNVVGFYGKYIPLQGVDTIVRAAALLQEGGVQFELIGSGQTYPAVKKLAEELHLSNVHFTPRVPYESLPERIATWSVVLGIFGTSAKSDRVIPNKVYEPAGMGKAIITKDSPAIRELFTPGKDIVTCAATPEDLAHAISVLMQDSLHRIAVGTAAHALYQSTLTPTHAGSILKRLFEQLSSRP